ncbi:hypothetical protein KCV07_g9234, partial [Aureobasidium melanogenum]
MTSWLASTVSDKLAEALAYKTAKHHGIKPEPSLLLDVSENGSNLKVRVNMPTVSLQVLKVQGSVLTVTDGAVSIQARLSSLCKERFQNQYSPSLSFIEKKSITSTISDITHTSLGPLNSRIQLLLSSLTISHNPLDLSGTTVDRITPVHTIEKIRTYLIQLQQLHQSAAEPLTADHDTVSALVPTDTSDLDMVEAPSNAPNAAERTTPLKRPHALSSPNHPGSHRVVKPRIHNEDQDVIIQTGINLQQPVQLQSNDSQELKRLLSLNKSGARASVSTAREQALRLGGLMSAQMAPPPVPAAGNSNVQPQPLSQPASQSTSQTFESQIPMADAPVVESAGTDPYPENTSVVQPESGNMSLDTRSRIHQPNNTPTSAQPEPLEVTQSSLPRVPPPRAPLPSQSEALAASLATSSSHLLDTSSSGIQGSLHRAPPASMIKYARRPIPENQSKLLEKYSSWWPSRPGTTFPHPNIPVEVLDKAEKAAERRAVKQKEEERNMQLQEENEREPASLSNALPVIQETQDTILSWESSPEHHTRPRSRMDTLRRSTNFVDPEPLPAKLPPGELPPDSSAEDHMQVDNPEVDDFLEQIPSSPPSGSVSQESYASGLDIPVPPQPSLRQLPEYPLGSPEENSSRSNPGSQPDKSELQDPPAKSISYNESRPERDVGASSPILEVAASPQPRKELEGKSSLLSQRPEDDTVMDDEPEANNDPVVDGQERHIVAESPKPQSRRDRRTSWGLSESAETIEQRRSRMKREFFEQRRETTTPNTNLSIVSESLLTAQLSDEIGKNLEAPDLNADSQPDPMEVDGPPLEPAKPANPSIAMIDQWRRQSSQKDDRSVCETSSTGKRPEFAAPGSNVSDHAVPGPSVTEPAALKVNVPESPVRSVRSLPSKPLRIADVQVRESSLQTRQQINKGPFGEPSRALWVGSLPEDIDNRQLEKLFAEFNPISVSAKNQSGFVNFANTETACRAFEAKHNSPLDGKVIVCKFAAPRGPVPMFEFSDRRPIPDPDRLVKPASTPARSTANKSPALTVDDLFRQLVSKRNFKGNRTAFETLCKDLHTSSDIPTPQWDNYVVLQPAEYLPWASRTIANGGKVVDYEAYWRDHLQKTAKPDLDPVLTPARLDAIFSKTRAVESPPIRFIAPVTPQTTPGARRPMPPPVQETPPSTSSHTPRAAADDLRRSVVERNAQSTINSLRDVASEQPHPFSDLPEPRRTSKWLRQNFTRDPKGRIVQQKLYQMYKEAFANATVPLILGGPFIEHVFNIFPGQTTTAFDEQGNKVFYCTGLRIKPPTRSMRTETSTPEYKIRGISAPVSGGRDDRSGYPSTTHTPAQQQRPRDRHRERDLISRGSLPFAEEQRDSRSRSPPYHSAPTRAPKGKPSPLDHLLLREDLDAGSENPEYSDFSKKYRSLGNVTKKVSLSKTIPNMVPFDASRNRAELNLQEILGEHPFPELKIYSGIPSYNDSCHWHGSDPILSSLSVGSLARFGAINVDPRTNLLTVPTYPAVDESLKNRYFDPAGTARYNDAQFHPIFRRKNFPIMDDYDYELLKPVLKVATELLSSFDTLGFFKGLFNAWKFPGTPEEQHLLGKGMMWRFSPRNVDSWDEAMETIQQLRELGDYVTWQYDDSRSAHRQASMCTYQDPTKPIYPEGRVFFKQQGYYTQICMSTSFRDALARKHRVEDIHPELDQYAADLRTRFYMAMIMVHETAHAFHNVFNSTGHFQKHEPFMNDGRVAELGHAITKHLLGNVIQITGANPEHLGVPFGFCFFDWPDSANRGLKKVMRNSLAKAGVHTHTYYVLPMSYILKVLHPQFWTDEVMRYGTIASLRPPKDLGVRYRYDDYELWLNEHESDVECEVLPPDELRPDVAEGIITQDTAIPLDFHSEAYKDQSRNLATHTRPWEFVKDLNMKYFPLTWDLIDRFDPEANVSGNVIAPLNADPRFDAVVHRNELRTFLRKIKLRKTKEKEKKIKRRKERLDVLRKNKGSKVTKV